MSSVIQRWTRQQAASELTAMGLPISPANLAVLAHRGTGPATERWGRRIVYEPTTVIAWAEARLRAGNEQESLNAC